jgi:hypothetical protein
VQASQAGRLREEVGLLKRQYDDAKRNYDHEVMQHGDALKRYASGWGRLWIADWKGSSAGKAVWRRTGQMHRLLPCLFLGSTFRIEKLSSATVIPGSAAAPCLQPWRPPTPACSSG